MSDDIAPNGATVTLNDVTYHLKPRITSDACLRALRRMVEQRNREAASDAMKDASKMLKAGEITAAIFDSISEKAAEMFVARADVQLDGLGHWLSDVEGIAVALSVCCDELTLDQAKELVGKDLVGMGTVLGALVNQEDSAAKN